jgi:hypothetical protein
MTHDEDVLRALRAFAARRWTSVMQAAFVLGLAAFVGCSHPCRADLQAQKYDSKMDCLEPPMKVGCTEATACDDSLTWAIDAQAQCFFFPTLCVPAGFTVLSFNDPRCPAVSPSPPACLTR